MQKKKIVQNVLVKRLEPYGFVYDTYVHGRWQMQRTLENNVEQYIAVCKSPHHPREVRLEMNTSVEFRSIKMYTATDVPKYSVEYLDYSSDEEFTQILELFGDFIVEIGLKKLDEISIPSTLVLPDEQMYLDIYENNVDLADNFLKRNKLDKDCSLEDGYTIIKQILNEDGERVYDQEAKQLLTECAAFLSNKIICTYGGNWEWSKHYNDCCINNVNGIRNPRDFLKHTVFAWQESKSGGMEELYERILISVKRKEMFQKDMEAGSS